jgi:hypothetical protein
MGLFRSLQKPVGGTKMSTNFINRINDEEIIDIIRSIMSQGTMVVETINESIFVALMEQRLTPILNYTTSRDIKADFERWKKDADI